ncbi:MAG: hypothetical protein M1378_11950 [Bacteroidetes bacterium]|nr:hypothetical protein [Bacteroidota bacterium]
MAETKQVTAVTIKDPAIKVLIGLVAAVVTLLILAVTFTGGYFAGSRTGKPGKGAANGAIGRRQGMMGQRFNKQGRQQLKNRLNKLGGGFARGEVTDVADGSLTVKRAGDDKSIKVVISGDTKIVKQGQTASLADIKQGDTIVAAGKLAGDTLQAKIVRIGAGAGPMMGPGQGL